MHLPSAGAAMTPGGPRRAGELRFRPPTCSTCGSATQNAASLARGTLADLFERNLESIRVIAPLVGGGFRHQRRPFYPGGGGDPSRGDEASARPGENGKKIVANIFWPRPRSAISTGRSGHRRRQRRQRSLASAPACCTTPARYLPWGHHRAIHCLDHTAQAPMVNPRPTKIESTVAPDQPGAEPPSCAALAGPGKRCVRDVERLMDRVARELKIDRAELRARQTTIHPTRCPIRRG